VQYLADIVVLITDAATGKPVLAVIIEPQLRSSKTRRYSWPVYLTTARRVSKCPRAVLVVLCPDPAEARKCRTPIRTGHPGFDLVPMVIDSSAPPGAAGGGPYLTVFAASSGSPPAPTPPSRTSGSTAPSPPAPRRKSSRTKRTGVSPGRPAPRRRRAAGS
jgi:hypothetical protein